jgi:hypothetical protein
VLALVSYALPRFQARTQNLECMVAQRCIIREITRGRPFVGNRHEHGVGQEGLPLHPLPDERVVLRVDVGQTDIADADAFQARRKEDRLRRSSPCPRGPWKCIEISLNSE